ncbi:MAG: VWA domain-containing protein [Polyangiaceae bacterium]|nr:VWA domain-containing protein [Polyangiaceae bacterium]
MYKQLFSKSTPGCILILIDQSGSMDEGFNGAQPNAADPFSRKDGACAMAVNRVIREIALAAQKGDVISPRCDLGVVGYGRQIGSAFRGTLQGKGLVSIADVAVSPQRVDTVKQKVPDGAGGLVDMEMPFPVWVDPIADGSTPMADAFELGAGWVREWVASHENSFPPVIINITDGAPDDAGRAATAAQAISNLKTSDGSALLLNVHISQRKGHAISLPDAEGALPDEYAKFLFRMSSVLPAPLQASAAAQGFNVSPSSRGFIYNADAETLVRLLAFGSNPTGR